MSNRRQKLLDLILNQQVPIQVYQASVETVDLKFNQCTVRLLPSDLVVENVVMVAEEDAEGWFCIRPKIDSLVLVGCVYNQVSQMFLLQCGEIDSGDIRVGDTAITFNADSIKLLNSGNAVNLDANTVTVNQSDMTLELSNGKVKIANAGVSLKSLFDDLSTLIQNLKVITAQGPSTALTPDTIAELTQFKAKYPLLLQ